MAYNREDMITWNELAPSLQTVLKGYESGIEALNQKYQAEHLSLTNVEANLATMIQDLSQATAQMQESLDELVSTQNEAKGGIGTLNATQLQMREDLENAASSIKEGIDACGEIEKTIRASCSSIDEQIQELNVTQGAIRNLCSNLDVNVKSELDALNSTCSQLESTARSIKSNGSTLSQTCDRIESVTNAINSALSTLNSTGADVNGYCASLESSARNIATTLSAVNQTVAILSSACNNVDTSCKAISSAMTTLNNTTRSVDTSAASLDATCKTINTTCLGMKNVLDSILSSLNLLGQSSADTRTAALAIAKDTSSIKEAILAIAQTTSDTRTNMNSNHAEVKALLESIKQNGTGSGGGTTPTPEVVFNLSDVDGAVAEFGSLTEEEQILANVYKKNGMSDAQIVAWLRNYRNAQTQPEPDEEFDINKVSGGSAYAPLTEEEQILANAYKKAGKTDTEILAWLIEYRESQLPEPDPVFNLEDTPGAVAEFGSLTEDEQTLANAYKKNGQSDADIIAWLRAKRLSEAVFELSDVDGAVAEFGSLTPEEQTLANSKKRSGQTDAQIIEWLREKRTAEATFNLADVPGAVAEFGSLTEEEQTLANSYKRAGQTNDEIIAWLRAKRLAEVTFNLEDVPGAVAEFGSLTDDEQILANTYKQNGKSNDEILEAIRTARNTAINAELTTYSNVLNAATDLDVHKESSSSHSTTTTSNRYMLHHVNTNYSLGDIVRLAELPTHLVLAVTTAGTTSQVRPNFANRLGVTGNVERGRAALLVSRTAAIRSKIANGSTTVNAEILALHREVYDHEYDQDAHDLTSTSRFVHKTNHSYAQLHERVFANNLPPHFVLEVSKTGTSGATAPTTVVKARSVASYTAPTLTIRNRNEVLDGIESELGSHLASSTAHKADLAEYLFDTNSSGYQVVPYGNTCYLCALAS